MISEAETREKLAKALADRAQMQIEIRELLTRQAAITQRLRKLQQDAIACAGVIAGVSAVLEEAVPGQEEPSQES